LYAYSLKVLSGFSLIISVVNSYIFLFWKIHFLKENMKYWFAIFPDWREEPKERRSIYKESLLAILLIYIYTIVRNNEHTDDKAIT